MVHTATAFILYCNPPSGNVHLQYPNRIQVYTSALYVQIYIHIYFDLRTRRKRRTLLIVSDVLAGSRGYRILHQLLIFSSIIFTRFTNEIDGVISHTLIQVNGYNEEYSWINFSCLVVSFYTFVNYFSVAIVAKVFASLKYPIDLFEQNWPRNSNEIANI